MGDWKSFGGVQSALDVAVGVRVNPDMGCARLASTIPWTLTRGTERHKIWLQE